MGSDLRIIDQHAGLNAPLASAARAREDHRTTRKRVIQKRVSGAPEGVFERFSELRSKVRRLRPGVPTALGFGNFPTSVKCQPTACDNSCTPQRAAVAGTL